jgi:hypothetical protein
MIATDLLLMLEPEGKERMLAGKRIDLTEPMPEGREAS